jgi:hypothetical protein
MKTTRDWQIPCKKVFRNLNANACDWDTCNQWKRDITRDFYLAVHDAGNPNPSGYISENAYVNKMNKKKTVIDHCYSPQFVGRMIMDNRDIYLTDYEKFKEVFWYSCKTIVVIQKENEALSDLTDNGKNGYQVLVPTNMKYSHLGIKLYQRKEGRTRWKYVLPLPTNVLDVPEELLEYEKQYLVE